MKIKKTFAILLAFILILGLLPVNVAAATRPFPQRGQDSGIMVNMLLPPGATANPSAPENVDLQILRQFARLVDNDLNKLPIPNPFMNPNTAFAIFGAHDTHSLFMVDPASRTDPNAFRMVLFNPVGTGPGLTNSVTVCESMGYGMLMLVKLAGSEDVNLGPTFQNRTMREVLHRGLPVQLRSQIPVSEVSFQMYFDAMFRTVRHFPSFHINIATGHTINNYQNAQNINTYRGAVPGAGHRRSYQMAWALNHNDSGIGHFHRTGGVPGASPSTATDGTIDIAYSLILAAEQWGNDPVWCHSSPTAKTSSYMDWAVNMVGEMWESLVHHSRHGGVGTGTGNLTPSPAPNPAGYFLKIGNWANSNSASGRLSRPSDHAMQHLRAFKAICQNPHSNWQRVIDSMYDSHRFVRNMPAAGGAGPNSTGFLPDFIRFDHINSSPLPNGTGNAWLIPSQSYNYSGRFLETGYDGAVHWNAGRVPWRFGVDVMFAGQRPHEDITIRRINDWYVNQSVNNNWAGANGVRGRWLNGSPAASNTDTNLFTGPMLVPAAIYGPQQWLTNGWNRSNAINAVLGNSGWRFFNFFGDYVNILTMIPASGNEWTPVGSSLTINGGTTTGGHSFVRRVTPGARVPLRTDNPNFTSWNVSGATFWPGHNANTSNTYIRMPLHQNVVATVQTGEICISNDITCPIFLAYVRSLNGIPTTGTILPSHAANITVIAAPNRGITSLEGIHHFSNVRNIIIQGNDLTTLDVSGFEYLEHLNASNNLLTSINVNGAISLAALSISRNNIGTITGINSLANLRVFWAEENSFTSLAFHASAPLQMVDVRGNTPSLSRSSITGVAALLTWDQIATIRPQPWARLRVVSGLAY